jgi:hypothetical protein
MGNKWLKRLVRLFLPVYQIESDKMKILYAGYSSGKKKYCIRLLLDRKNNSTFLGRRWFWKIPDLVKSGNYDIVIAEISPLTFNHFNKCNGYILPLWVTMRINIDRPISEIIKRSVSDFSDVIRRIRKYNLTYEILTGKEDFNDFNDKFYLPYITKRYEEDAMIEDLNKLWKSSPSPFLMSIIEDGKIVGMSLIRKSGSTFYFLRLGLLNGNEEYRSHGVIGAMYYFCLLEGQKMGCQYLNLGGTKPFLTDGLTKFKMGLGAEFVLNNDPSNEVYLWLGVNENSVSANEFMHKNPFMYTDKDHKLFTTSIK